MIWHRVWMGPDALAAPDIVTVPQLNSVFAGGNGRYASRLTPPWPRNQSQGFWERYLDRWEALSGVAERECRRALVPARTSRPIEVEADQDDARVGAECFLHPWGASLVVTVNLRATGRGHEETVDRLMELNNDPCYVVDGRIGWVQLGQVAGEAFKRVREEHAPGVDEHRAEPFSVLTVLAANGGASNFDPAAEPSARFLHGAASLSSTWETDALPELSAATVARLSRRRETNLIYGSDRGRAIWTPTIFGGNPASSTLSCLHRNQTLAAMQTEAMSRFVADTVGRLEDDMDLSAEHMSRSRFAAEQLAKLYRGDARSYRSGCMPAQIDAGHHKEKINYLLVANGRPPLP
jgi:hypothetical protein